MSDGNMTGVLMHARPLALVHEESSPVTIPELLLNLRHCLCQKALWIISYHMAEDRLRYLILSSTPCQKDTAECIFKIQL